MGKARINVVRVNIGVMDILVPLHESHPRMLDYQNELKLTKFEILTGLQLSISVQLRAGLFVKLLLVLQVFLGLSKLAQ